LALALDARVVPINLDYAERMPANQFIQREDSTMKRYLCCLVALGLLHGLTGHLKAQPTYSFATLDVPGASFLAAPGPTG
jgi:hypothetical protein